MRKEDFEGSLVLEQIAAIGERDTFFDALDGDDFETARDIMERAGLDEETIETVLQKMEDADGEH